MGELQVGRLERVPLRDTWLSESSDFTPWLARQENLALLGEAIGRELELEAQEQPVGPFRADLLCRIRAKDHWVLIEKQLERTNHAHLGQLLTYAAGLQTVTIVWIAAQFTEEHRATIDWLNEITNERFEFFAIEIELWRIGNSLAAPRFNVVSKPNDWVKAVSGAASGIEAAALTETKQLQLEYWVAFTKFLEDRGSSLKPTTPRPRPYMTMSFTRPGFYLVATASSWNEETNSYAVGEVRAEISFNHRDAKAHFIGLQTARGAIEEELGEALNWHGPAEAKSCSIYLRQTADITDRSRWPAQHLWLQAKLESLQRTFGPRIRSLSA